MDILTLHRSCNQSHKIITKKWLFCHCATKQQNLSPFQTRNREKASIKKKQIQERTLESAIVILQLDLLIWPGAFHASLWLTLLSSTPWARTMIDGISDLARLFLLIPKWLNRSQVFYAVNGDGSYFVCQDLGVMFERQSYLQADTNKILINLSDRNSPIYDDCFPVMTKIQFTCYC